MFKIDLPPEPKGWEEIKPIDYEVLQRRIAHLETRNHELENSLVGVPHSYLRQLKERIDGYEEENAALETKLEISQKIQSEEKKILIVEIEKNAILVDILKSLIDFHKTYLKNTSSDMPGNDYYSKWLMDIVNLHKKAIGC